MSSMAASRSNLHALRDMVRSKIKGVLCAYDHSFSFAAVDIGYLQISTNTNICKYWMCTELAKSYGWGGLSCK